MDEVIRKVVRGDVGRQHHVETAELLEYSRSQGLDGSSLENTGAEKRPDQRARTSAEAQTAD